MEYPQPVAEHCVSEITIKLHNIVKNNIALEKAGYIMDANYDTIIAVGDALYSAFENITIFTTDQQHKLDIAYAKFLMI